MKERPILFSGPMVRAILEGRKTQTRRVIKARNVRFEDGIWQHDVGDSNYALPCPYGKPGDRLWVKETCLIWPGHEGNKDTVIYRASCTDERRSTKDMKGLGLKWRPSIHMPRWASRLTLEIVSVRVERLQDISGDDARAEGVPCSSWSEEDWVDSDGYPTCADQREQQAIEEYADLWESINSVGSWDANPWVWVVEFKVVQE